MTSFLASGTLPETAGLDRAGQSIIGALPFPKGKLRDVGCFRLDADGRSSVLEGTPAAWWPDGSIKWLRLTGAVDLSGGGANPFTLASVPDTEMPGLSLRHLPGIEEILTPSLSIRVSPDPHRVLEVRDREGRRLTRGPGLSASLRLQGAADRPETVWTFEPGNIRVVEKTRTRIVLRLAGRFVEDGRLVAELVTFIETVAGEPRLGIQPVFIYLGDPDRDRVASLQVTVHTAYGASENARFGFGRDRGPGCWDECQWLPDGHRWPQARLVQAGSSFYRIDKRTGPAGGWVKILEGSRAQGWCHLGDDTGGATAAIRYFWQEYPRTLSVDADAGTLSFGLVPSESEPLDLKRYSPVLLGTTNYEAGEGAFGAQTHGATGIAKSNELMVRFHPAGADRLDAARAGLAWVHPVRLVPDPQAFAASGVAGALEAVAPAGCEDGERRLAELADFLFAERDVRGWYGLMDYGDIMETYYSGRGQWAYDDGGYGWINTESLPDLGLWLMALRHGRPDWLEGAIAMTRHNRDVDMYHRGNFKGVGSRHNVNHWGCKDKEWRVSMPLVKRFHDYLTGDPWTREVILETVAVYQSYDRTAGVAPSMASALAGLMVKAELTGRPEDHAVVEKALTVFAGAVREDGHMVRSIRLNLATGEGAPALESPGTAESANTLMGSYFFLLGFGGQQILTEAARTYAHGELTRALVRHADLYFQAFDLTRWALYQVPRPNAALAFLAFAFRETGNPKYREAVRKALTEWHGPVIETEGGDGLLEEPARRALAGQQRRNKITCAIGDLMHLRPYGYAAVR